MVLGDRLHDPQPIPATVKRVLQDFKRTHQDNWIEHKVKRTRSKTRRGETGLPKKDARFSKLKNTTDLLSEDREGKIIKISTLNI